MAAPTDGQGALMWGNIGKKQGSNALAPWTLV